MVYREYHRIRVEYLNTLELYNSILNEKEVLFAQTQPAIKLDKERVGGGKDVNTFDSYIMAKDRKRIDERLAEAKNILLERLDIMEQKERELRNSYITDDIIFTLYFLDGIKPTDIARRVYCSPRTVFRKLRSMKSMLAHFVTYDVL